MTNKYSKQIEQLGFIHEGEIALVVGLPLIGEKCWVNKPRWRTGIDQLVYGRELDVSGAPGPRGRRACRHVCGVWACPCRRTPHVCVRGVAIGDRGCGDHAGPLRARCGGRAGARRARAR